MEYTTETVEIEEICEDGIPVKKFKQFVKGYDQTYITDWKGDPNYKNWIEKAKKDDETTTTVTTYQLAECIELSANEPKNQIEVKSIKKTNSTNTVTPARNNRSGKRQIRVMDPNLPSFVCTEHNENISLDCRYCRIASGFKKKNTQRHVQNDEISSTGKVTVAIPKRDPNIIHMKTAVNQTLEGNRETFNTHSSGDNSVNVVQKVLTPGKYVQKFRSEWLKLPEFKDWLVECKVSGDGDMSQAQCKFCGTLLVNNSNNLVRHAISKKHMKNMELENSDFNSSLERQEIQLKTLPMILVEVRNEEMPNQNQKTVGIETKEEIFGNYVASELKRIKNKKTYEEVKWKILQTLQSAAEKEAEDLDKSASE